MTTADRRTPEAKSPAAGVFCRLLVAAMFLCHAVSLSAQTEKKAAERVKPAEKKAATSTVKKTAADQTGKKDPANAGTTGTADSPKKTAEAAITDKPSTENKPAAEPAKKLTPEEEKKLKQEKEQEEKKVKWIKNTISYGIQKDRREAINIILTVKNESHRQELYDLLIDTLKKEFNSDARAKILTVMGEMKIKRGEDVVLAQVEDDAEEVQVAAVYTLKSMEASSTKNKLIEKLKKQKMDTDSRFIEALLVTLGDFKAAELMPFVKENVESNATAASVRERMVLFMGNINTPEAKALLKKLYIDEEEDLTIRSYAVNALSKLGATDVTADIKKILAAVDSYPFKKRQRYYTLTVYSVAALVKLGDADAVPRLMDSLKSDNATVRLRAVELIKEMGDKRTIDILKYKMEYDSDARVRKAAEDALKNMGVDTEKKDKDKKEEKTVTEKKEKKKTGTGTEKKIPAKPETVKKDKPAEAEKPKTDNKPKTK